MSKRRNTSEAYRAGAAALRSAASRHGTVNLSPSIAQREEWRGNWREFMAGWNAEKKRRENVGAPGSAFKRCVKSVSEKGGAYDPRAVCAAAGRKKYGSKKFAAMAQAGKRRAKRGNPAGEAAQAFADFHGRPSTEVVTVQKQVHYHSHLAAAGELMKLVVISSETGERVTLQDFGGALACFNERRTQIYIEGGDQKVDLGIFGLDVEHDSYNLGEVASIEYYTTKDHLGSEGGTATYVHKFSKPRPTLIYDAMNEQLEFSGGKYSVPAEGIDQ